MAMSMDGTGAAAAAVLLCGLVLYAIVLQRKLSRARRATAAAAAGTDAPPLKRSTPREVVVVVLDFASLCVTYVLRLASGSFIARGVRDCRRPAALLVLYEYEACNDCRRVREALSTLDIDYLVKPCPLPRSALGESPAACRFRPEAAAVAAKAGLADSEASALAEARAPLVPLLVDANANVNANANANANAVDPGTDSGADAGASALQGAANIVPYLWETYGNAARKPRVYWFVNLPFMHWTGHVGSAARMLAHQGRRRLPSRSPPAEPLVLWGYEGSPFVTRVRELLCALELPYLSRTTPKFSSLAREEYRAKFGHRVSAARLRSGLIQIPLLEDPAKGKAILESTVINEYLRRAYRLESLDEEPGLSAESAERVETLESLETKGEYEAKGEEEEGKGKGKGKGQGGGLIKRKGKK